MSIGHKPNFAVIIVGSMAAHTFMIDDAPRMDFNLSSEKMTDKQKTSRYRPISETNALAGPGKSMARRPSEEGASGRRTHVAPTENLP
jgi:hypothetical protein